MSLRVILCLLILGLSTAITLLYHGIVLGRPLSSENVVFSLQSALFVSLVALKITQAMRPIALDNDARLFCIFTLVSWGALSLIIIAFRINYSGSIFAIFNSVFVPCTAIALYLLSKRPVVIGVFSADLEPNLKQFGSIVNLAGAHDAAIRHCDVVVGRISPRSDMIGEPVDSTDSRAMERLMMLGDTPTASYDDFMETKSGKIGAQSISSLTSVSRPVRLMYSPLKRLTDLLLCIPIGLFLFLVTPFVCIAIKIDSPGPIFFVQRRFGFRGKSFKLYKFRTMLHDKDYATGLGTDDGYRITKVGAVLRKTRLDELPQFINVLKGDMSWIGPRPETVALARRYIRSVPHFRLRHLVRPGVTGWAQVHQGYTFGEKQFHEKVLYDLYYIKYFSLSLDLIIAFKTIAVIVGAKGAR